MRELLRDRNFLLLMFAFGIAVGAFYSIVVLFGHMIPQSGVRSPLPRGSSVQRPLRD